MRERIDVRIRKQIAKLRKDILPPTWATDEQMNLMDDLCRGGMPREYVRAEFERRMMDVTPDEFDELYDWWEATHGSEIGKQGTELPPSVLAEVGGQPAVAQKPQMWWFYVGIALDVPPSIDTPEEAEAYIMETLRLDNDIMRLPGYVRHGMDKPPEPAFR